MRPDSGDEELRLKVSALPLRLRVDQDVIAFLQVFLSEEIDTLLAEPEHLEAQDAPAVAQQGMSITCTQTDLRPG